MLYRAAENTNAPFRICMSNCRHKIRFCLPTFYSSSKGGFNQQPIHSMFTLAAIDFLEESLSFNTKVLDSVQIKLESHHQALIATIFLFTILQVIFGFFAGFFADLVEGIQRTSQQRNKK